MAGVHQYFCLVDLYEKTLTYNNRRLAKFLEGFDIAHSSLFFLIAPPHSYTSLFCSPSFYHLSFSFSIFSPSDLFTLCFSTSFSSSSNPNSFILLYVLCKLLKNVRRSLAM
eukprot:Phypoly_transcript_11100.p1 GENE.Phypoly_transcript_11100~~Phypoly_transcript_11100.p1  ORF type:complete len:111 (+),score=12.08 Phypoly_transcript_11100:517-849(+)